MCWPGWRLLRDGFPEIGANGGLAVLRHPAEFAAVILVARFGIGLVAGQPAKSVPRYRVCREICPSRFPPPRIISHLLAVRARSSARGKAPFCSDNCGYLDLFVLLEEAEVLLVVLLDLVGRNEHRLDDVFIAFVADNGGVLDFVADFLQGHAPRVHRLDESDAVSHSYS